MIEIERPPKASTFRIALFLSEHVGPRRYWLHNEVGGDGWVIRDDRIILSSEDESVATFIKLKFL